MNKRKTIGILGGMGPLATCDLFRKIIEVTKSDCDQQHVRVCIDSNTAIADRTKAILEHSADPVPEMVKSAVRLQGMGGDVLIMSCNTAHYFYDKLIPFVDIPFINMLDETADVLVKKGIKKAGLLAADGTLQSGVYEHALSRRGIAVEIPSKENQWYVMSMIYDGVKAGKKLEDASGFIMAAEELLNKGAQTLILGCTELPVAFAEYGFQFPTIDPTLILASRTVQFLGMDVKDDTRY